MPCSTSSAPSCDPRAWAPTPSKPGCAATGRADVGSDTSSLRWLQGQVGAGVAVGVRSGGARRDVLLSSLGAKQRIFNCAGRLGQAGTAMQTKLSTTVQIHAPEPALHARSQHLFYTTHASCAQLPLPGVHEATHLNRLFTRFSSISTTSCRTVTPTTAAWGSGHGRTSERGW